MVPSPESLTNLQWRVARLCHSGNCVTVAANDSTIVIGNSKDPNGPVLSYSHDEWRAFVDGIRQGDFDDLT